MILKPLLLLMLALAHQAVCDCGMDSCTNEYHRTIEYEGLSTGRYRRYCEVLARYRECLDRLAGPCRGDISYHSAAIFMRRQWLQLQCDRHIVIDAAPTSQDGLTNAAPVQRSAPGCRLFSPQPSEPIRHCSLWGDPHLRTLDGRVHACAEVGARPMIDNRFFLIQVSTAQVRTDSVLVAVNKVTVIIRAHNCTTMKRYEASSDSEDLPAAFVDDSTHSTADGVKAVEVIRSGVDHVTLELRHAPATIIVRRRGPYLSVALTIPQHTLTEFPSSSLPSNEQLCHGGCPLQTLIPLPAALADPQKFSACHIAPISLPKKLAIDRCRTLNTTDDFFDACVFDLTFTGDESLATMSKDAQSDLEGALSQGLPYSIGRVDLKPYEHLTAHQWTGCAPPIPSSSIISSSLISSSLLSLLSHCVLVLTPRLLF